MKYYIYKIYKPETEYLYIGSTNKLSTRKSHHKKNTNNRAKKSYHRVLYKTIRENGGLEAFIFEKLEEIEVQTPQEARLKELEYITRLKPSLNMISPTIQKTINPPLDIIGPL